jgi:hypothetical protein
MRIIVCGARNFPHLDVVDGELTKINMRNLLTTVIHGCSGALGSEVDRWARSYGIPIVHYPHNWEYHGKKGEQVRNAFMLEDARPDLVVAFPGGCHTADLVRRAVNIGVAVLVIPEGCRKEAALFHANMRKLDAPRYPCHTEKRAER